MKVYKNIILNGYNDKPIKAGVRNENGEIESKDLKLDFALRLILNNSQLQSQQDSINGMKLATALDNAGETIEIAEDDVFEWLKKSAEKLTPPLFNVNGNIIYKHICEGFEKD